MTIRERLFLLADEQYADFQAQLTPTIDRKSFIGVRVPEVRKLAKELYRLGGYSEFLKELPHVYYDENMLHGVLLSEFKDFESCISLVDAFLPYVDNWAVCDIMSPKVFKTHKPQLIEKIREWSSSGHTYTVRFGIEMLMSHYLDEDFQKEYLEIPAVVRSEEYYVRMMVAWFFATALSKQWDATLPFMEARRLDPWTHNKTIQKARESFRISNEQKTILKSMMIPNVRRLER